MIHFKKNLKLTISETKVHYIALEKFMKSIKLNKKNPQLVHVLQSMWPECLALVKPA